jgi:hypothetical protein
MPKKPQPNLVLLIYLIFSAFGLVAVVLLVLYPPSTSIDIPFRKPVVGAVFTLICAFGGFATLFPKECSKMLGSHKEDKSVASHTAHSEDYSIRGHHPDCEGFSSHVIRINGRVLCAACTGLFLGAIFATVGTVAYFFAGLEIEQFGFSAVAFGLGFVVLGFVQFRFRSFVRLLLNVVFVVGAFFILVGMDALMENLLVDFYLASLVILWIFTRILLSEWDHLRICRFCMLECKVKK